jgi:hypothetical protein
MVRSSLKDSYYFPSTEQSFMQHVLLFDYLLRDQVKDLYAHMKLIGVEPSAIFLSWIVRLFSDVLSDSMMWKFIDCFVCDGFKLLYRFALGIMNVHQFVLKRTVDKENFYCVLQSCIANTEVDPFTRGFVLKLPGRKELLKIVRSKELNAVSALHLPRSRCTSFRIPTIRASSLQTVTMQEIVLLWSWLPERLRLLDPIRVFNPSIHGYTLASLRSETTEALNQHGMFVIIQSSTEEIIGCFIAASSMSSSSLTHSSASFASSQDSFLFTLRPHRARYAPASMVDSVTATGYMSENTSELSKPEHELDTNSQATFGDDHNRKANAFSPISSFTAFLEALPTNVNGKVPIEKDSKVLQKGYEEKISDSENLAENITHKKTQSQMIYINDGKSFVLGDTLDYA